jgi:hypothetical protein
MKREKPAGNLSVEEGLELSVFLATHLHQLNVPPLIRSECNLTCLIHPKPKAASSSKTQMSKDKSTQSKKNRKNVIRTIAKVICKNHLIICRLFIFCKDFVFTALM